MNNVMRLSRDPAVFPVSQDPMRPSAASSSEKGTSPMAGARRRAGRLQRNEVLPGIRMRNRVMGNLRLTTADGQASDFGKVSDRSREIRRLSVWLVEGPVRPIKPSATVQPTAD